MQESEETEMKLVFCANRDISILIHRFDSIIQKVLFAVDLVSKSAEAWSYICY